MTSATEPTGPAAGTGGAPRRGPASLTAREIAEALPADEWRTVASATVYPHAQRRLAVTVSMNTSPEVFRYIEDEDYSARSKFAEELLEIIGDDLSANDEMALIRALGKRLTAWQARRGSCGQHGCTDNPVRECLEEVLREHVGARAGVCSCPKCDPQHGTTGAGTSAPHN